MKAIIMAGGSGTRLWPLSRSKYPKQFLKLKGKAHSFFQMAIERCRVLCELEDIYVVTVQDYEFIIRLQLEELGHAPESVHVLVEPQPKNTLPAIYNGVKAIREASGDDTVVVMSSDHLINDPTDLFNQIRSAVDLTKDYIFTFGIHPTVPETGFGYIMPGEALPVGYLIKEFKEKPDAETAKTYVDNGYYWNSGMFMFHTSLFEQEMKTHATEVHTAFALPIDSERFAQTPSISIDYGIMEKSSRTAVLPLKIDWDDLGSFATFYDTFSQQKDENGNIGFNGEVLLDSSNNLLYLEDGKACALIGINDLVVVDQGDALLLCHKDRTQDVKEAVNRLIQKKDVRAEQHLTDYQPWGSQTFLEDGPFYKINRLTVLHGKQLPYQMHYHRSEHWIVASGTATIVIDGKSQLVRTGESVFVPAGTKHGIGNEGRMLLEVIEVQSGQYLGGDDVVYHELMSL